jgi:hypothetical protein
MNCFNHRDSVAIGLCKNCAKGVCAACVVEATNGIACSEPCRKEVSRVAALIKSAKVASTMNHKGAGYFMPIFLLALGCAFAVHGLYFSRTGQPNGFGVIMGSLFAVFGVALAGIQYSWRKKSVSASET